MPYRPQEVAHKLGISPSTLRLWSTRFAAALSIQARKLAPDGEHSLAQRRYTDEDLALLSTARELLSQGLTYEETRRRLCPSHGSQVAPPVGDGQQQPPLLPEASQPSMASLRETLEAKERSIAALKESLAFIDVYLRTVLQEREDARAREQLLQREIEGLQREIEGLQSEVAKPWWKRFMAIP